MDFINKILYKSYKKNKKHKNILIYALMLIAIFAFMSAVQLEGVIVLVIPIIFTILHIIINKLFLTKYNFKITKFYKILQNLGYDENFFTLIESELKEENSIMYYQKIYEVGLIMTKNWFIFVSFNDPQIRRISEIEKISQELRTKDSSFNFVVKFIDDSYFVTDKINFESIEKEIKSKLPHIEIGQGIIEEGK